MDCVSFHLKVLEQRSDMIKMVLYEGEHDHHVEAALNGEQPGVREISWKDILLLQVRGNEILSQMCKE